MGEAGIIGVIGSAFVMLPIFGYAIYGTFIVHHMLGLILSVICFVTLVIIDTWLVRYFIKLRNKNIGGK